MSNDNTENENKYLLKHSTSFKKDLKKIAKQNQKLEKVIDVLKILSQNGVTGIPAKMKPHILIGNYKGAYECHIEPDLLIIWEQHEEDNEISLLRLGSHSELFG